MESLKLAGKLLIVPNAAGTALQFLCKQTLADEQPAPIPGSNNNTPFASVNYAGSAANGYIAYDFNDSNTMANPQLSQDSIANTPVIWRASIQDEDNFWIPDTVTVADIDLYNITQQKNTATLAAVGFPNYDQAYRAIRTKQSETYMGNPTGNKNGTWRWSIQSTFRGLHSIWGCWCASAQTALT